MVTNHLRKTPVDGDANGLAGTVAAWPDETAGELSDLRRSEARLRLAVEYAGIGIWEWDDRSGGITCSENTGPLFGLPFGSVDTSEAAILALIHPDDRERVLAAEQRHRAEGNDFAVEYRVVWPDGTVHWLEAKGRATARDGAGRVTTTLGVIVDITERKRAEVELREREDRIREIANTVPAMVWQTEADGRHTYVNDQTVAFTGWSGADTFDGKWSEAIHPDDRAEVMRAWDAALAARKPFRLEYRLRRHDGVYRWVVDEGRLRFAPDGRCVGVIGAAIDITESKRTEAELRASEERYRSLISELQVGVLLKGPHAEILFANQAALDVLGLAEVQLIGMTSADPTLDAVRDDGSPFPGESHPAQQAIATRRPVHDVVMGVRRPTTGERVWLQTDAVPQLAPDGSVTQVICTFADITERRRAEEAIRASEERYRSVVEAQTDLVCRYLPDTTLTFVNGAYCRWFGKSPDELIGTSFLALIPEPAREAARQYVESLIRNPRREMYEHQVTHPDGSICWQSWVDHAIVDEDGNVVELQGIGHDITDRKLAEERSWEAEARNRAMLEALPDLMFLQTRDGVYLDCHARDGGFYIPPEHFLGKNVRDVLPADIANQVMCCSEQAFVTGEPQLMEYRLPIEGVERAYEARIVRCGDNLLSIVREISERRRAEDDLQRLTGRLLRSQDEERRRIARELHETTAQTLVAVGLNLARMRHFLPEESTDATGTLAESRALIEQVLQEIRTLSYVLHPPLLDHRGLAEALRWYVDGFAKRSGIAVELVLPPDLEPFPTCVETAFFRIVQECLTNIHRHSGSFRAAIALAVEEDRLVLRVQDFGSVIDSGRSGESSGSIESVGVGIPGMRERLRQLGGRLDIVRDAAGTIVTATVPLPIACVEDEP
jgi:PAS domain S-box-containing protein